MTFFLSGIFWVFYADTPHLIEYIGIIRVLFV